MPKYEGINRNYESGIYGQKEEKTEAQKQEERDMLMKQFLEKGGKVEKLAPGNAKVYGSLSRGGKPPYTDAQLKAQWKAKNGSSNS
jgi:hypothetical protein